MVWSKALPSKLGETSVRAAVLLMNNANTSANVSVDLSSVHGLGSCAVDFALRDIWERTNSSVAGAVNTRLSPHASHFFVASCSNLEPVPTPPAPTPSSDCLEHAVRFDHTRLAMPICSVITYSWLMAQAVNTFAATPQGVNASPTESAQATVG